MSQTAGQLNETKIRQSWRDFHAAQKNPPANPDMTVLDRLIQEQAAKGVPEARVREGLSYVKRVLQECSEDEWVSFVSAGEPPPIKLAAKEMEALRGGEICVVGGALAYGIITLECTAIAAYVISR